MNAISIRSLRHSYREGQRNHTVLDNITADLTRGSVTALLGQSGSGKSTLLHLIGGLETIQGGVIDVFGESLAPMSERQRTQFRRQHIGFIYQSFNLIPTLTVAENIALPLALNRSSRAYREERINAVLDATGLRRRGQQFPDRLSGGEQQRVAIARAIAHVPRLILADEPTGNLDADTGRQCLALLIDLVRNQGCTLLLVTHSHEVADCADQQLVLQRGKLHHQGDNQLSESVW